MTMDWSFTMGDRASGIDTRDGSLKTGIVRGAWFQGWTGELGMEQHAYVLLECIAQGGWKYDVISKAMDVEVTTT